MPSKIRLREFPADVGVSDEYAAALELFALGGQNGGGADRRRAALAQRFPETVRAFNVGEMRRLARANDARTAAFGPRPTNAERARAGFWYRWRAAPSEKVAQDARTWAENASRDLDIDPPAVWWFEHIDAASAEAAIDAGRASYDPPAAGDVFNDASAIVGRTNGSWEEHAIGVRVDLAGPDLCNTVIHEVYHRAFPNAPESEVASYADELTEKLQAINYFDGGRPAAPAPAAPPAPAKPVVRAGGWPAPVRNPSATRFGVFRMH